MLVTNRDRNLVLLIGAMIAMYAVFGFWIIAMMMVGAFFLNKTAVSLYPK